MSDAFEGYYAKVIDPTIHLCECPICNNVPIMMKQWQKVTYSYFVHCDTCMLSMYGTNGPSADLLAAMWNQRYCKPPVHDSLHDNIGQAIGDVFKSLGTEDGEVAIDIYNAYDIDLFTDAVMKVLPPNLQEVV